jgi:hypothetical protein
MVNLFQAQKKALSSKLQRLGKRVDNKVVDGVFDEILKQIASLRSVSCTLADDSSLCLQVDDVPLVTVKVDRAKSVLRMMLARLSVRCSEWAGREVSPYGDHVELALPVNKLPCKVEFTNTPAVQRFEIKDNSAPQSLPSFSMQTITQAVSTELASRK